MDEPDDWRLQGQEKWLMGATLYYRQWVAPRPDWDHDHCEFCWETFSPHEGDTPRGYTTHDNYRWICEQCFRDFRERFGWTVGESNER